MDLLLSATEACPHGLALKRAGKILFANNSYARLLGYESAAALAGKSARERHRKQNGAELETLEFKFQHARRAVRLEILRDVTERRRLERHLREAQKMEALGRAVGGVAHDFNNLLTAVMLYCDLLRQQVPEGPGRRHTDEVKLAAQRGAALVRQMLAFARQQVLEPKVLSLNAIVLGMREMLQRLLGEDIAVVTRCAPSLGAVQVDPGQMQQVLLNLVVNARDAMAAGGKLEIETANVRVDAGLVRKYNGLRPGRHVRLIVRDSGCGMNAETLSHAFEPFFTTKPKGKGTGLGLATVYGIVTQSGGAISLESAPGAGTEVTILLPCTDKAARREPERGVQSQAGAPRAEAKAVLLVEDDAAVSGPVAQLLERAGHKVLLARSGEEAVRLVQQHAGALDLLICDLVLPGMNGREAAARLRAQRPEMAVVYTSGYAERIPKAGKAEPGAVFLQKPFTEATLARKMSEALANRAHITARRAQRARAGQSY